MKETKFYIQKAICFLLTFCIVVATLLQNAYALSNSVTTEILLPSEALSDTAIVDYLRNTNKLGEFYKAQNAIKQNYDEQTAQYAARMLNESDISSSDVEEIRTKYNLLLPNESKNGIIEKVIARSGEAVVQVGDIVKKGDLLIQGANTTSMPEVWATTFYESVQKKPYIKTINKKTDYCLIILHYFMCL